MAKHSYQYIEYYQQQKEPYTLTGSEFSFTLTNQNNIKKSYNYEHQMKIVTWLRISRLIWKIRQIIFMKNLQNSSVKGLKCLLQKTQTRLTTIKEIKIQKNQFI